MNYEELVGFDYPATILELARQMTYQQIAKAIGYKSKGSISAVLSGEHIPSHIQGEALWALYVDTFGHKPPLKCSTNSTVSTV